MDLEILKKYDIKFENSTEFGKLMFSPNLILNQFAVDTITEYDLIDTIEALNSVLKREVLNLSFSTDSYVTLDVEKEITKFYDHPEFIKNNSVLFSLPTNDLKEIILSWKEYLELE